MKLITKPQLDDRGISHGETRTGPAGTRCQTAHYIGARSNSVPIVADFITSASGEGVVQYGKLLGVKTASILIFLEGGGLPLGWGKSVCWNCRWRVDVWCQQGCVFETNVVVLDGFATLVYDCGQWTY